MDTNPAITYGTAGSFPVTLYATNASGTGSYTYSSISVTGSTPSGIGACNAGPLLAGLAMLALGLFIGGPFVTIIGYLRLVGEGASDSGMSGSSKLIVAGIIMFMIGSALLILSYIMFGQLYIVAGC